MNKAEFPRLLRRRPEDAPAYISDPDRLRAVALAWVCVSIVGLALNLLTSCVFDSNRPCTADFPDFALSARLALQGHARAAYDFPGFQALADQVFPHARDVYQFAYPPFLMLLTAPLGALPFWAGWLLWMVGGWLALALCVRRVFPEHWLLYTAALPAVFVNAVAGQNGLWTAAILGWGLILLPSRPILAGALWSLVLYKPHIALLLPIVLLCRCRREPGGWRALAGFCGGAAFLAFAATLAFGMTVWQEFIAHDEIVRTLILENGTGIFHRMVSVFALVRHSGASKPGAYAAQGCVTLITACLVATVWRSPAPAPLKGLILLLGITLSAPYLFDYDLALLALVPIWLRRQAPDWPNRLAAGALLVLPLFSAPVSRWTGVAVGSLVLVPAFAYALTRALPFVTFPKWAGAAAVGSRRGVARHEAM
jgi:hypothetical protein